MLARLIVEIGCVRSPIPASCAGNLNKRPRVLLYDLENAPLIGAAWEIHETDIIEVLEEPYILSVAYKWLGEKEIKVLSLPQFHGYRKYKPEDEEELITAFHKIMEEADFLCAHNGDLFDAKKLNATFLKYGLPPPKPVKSIDTLKAARRIAKFPSNKLDALGSVLGLGRKLPHTGKHLWFACMRGERKAWKMMCEYNKQDVVLLEKVYLRLRPYIPNHPALNVLTRRNECPVCGGTTFQKRGWHLTRTSEKQRIQCTSCGRWCLDKGEKLDHAVTIQ